MKQNNFYSKKIRTKKTFVYTLVATILIAIGCTKNIDAPIQENSIKDNDCNIQIYNYEAEINEIDQRIILGGKYHNEILVIADPFVDTQDCSSEELGQTTGLVGEIVNSNENYQEVFGDDAGSVSIANEIYNEKIGFCKVETSEEMKQSIITMYEDYIELVQNSDFFADIEVDLISDLLGSLITQLEETDNSKLDLTEYYMTVLNNQDSFLENGKFTLAILSVYDHSYCFWDERGGGFIDFDENQLRDIPWWRRGAALVVGILMPKPIAAGLDAVGALAGGIQNLYDTGGTYDPNDDFFEDMLSGATTVSSLGLL